MGKIYKKVNGSAGSKGVDFQINLLSIFFLNALRQNIKDWKLSTEHKLAGKFDDIVLELSEGSAIMVQAKYKETKRITLEQLFSTNCKNDDFSLPKYFFSYLDIKTKFHVKSIVICTNTRADSKTLKFLKQNNDCSGNMLHYKDGGDFFTFTEDIVTELIKNARIYYQNNLQGKDVDETVIIEENIKEFLSHLQLHLDYPSGNKVEKIIEKLLSSLKCFGDLLSNISHGDLSQKVKDWFENSKGIYITESQAIAMFCEIKSDKYSELLENYKLFFSANYFSIVGWSRNIFHVVAEKEYLLYLVKVFRSLQNTEAKVLYASPESEYVQEVMINAFELSTYTYLLIVPPKFPDEILIKRICYKLSSILGSRTYKKVIFVAECNNKLVRRMKFISDSFATIESPLTLQDLSEKTQEILLKKKLIVFQGEEVSLKELFPRTLTEHHKKIVKSETLEKLVRGETITVGVKLMDFEEDVSKYYIDRRFDTKVTEASSECETISEDDIYNIQEKMILISDSAGTGKTTVLTNLAIKIKKNNPLLWVVRIELNECTTVLKNALNCCKSVDIKELMNYKTKTRLNTDFELAVFSLEKKVVLMFDGIDEISPDYTELILGVLLQSQEATHIAKVFVTTRPHLTTQLETLLKVTSLTLVPFTEQNQVDFLRNYWSNVFKLNKASSYKCHVYARALVDRLPYWMMSNWTVAKNDRFMAFPLQARMLAEVFLENRGDEDWNGCKEFLNEDSTEPKLPEKMNIAQLYEMFIEKKRDIFLDKGNPSGNTAASQALRNQFDECLTYHRSLALEVILNERQRAHFSSYYTDLTEKEINMLKMGIVQKLENQLCLIHRTFAEYFVADILFKELQLQNHDAGFQRFLIEEIFSLSEFTVIRHFLDNLLRNFGATIPLGTFENYKSPRSNKVCFYRLLTRLFCYSSQEDAVLSERDRDTILHKLARDGNTEIIRLILKSVNFENCLFRTGFIKNNSLSTLQYLVHGEGIDIKDSNNETPLHRAVIGGYSDTVKFLVEIGADVNLKSEFRGTAAHIAVELDRWDIVDFLLQTDINLNVTDRQGCTPLHLAVEKNMLDIVKFFIAHGVDINIADSQGRTALHFAVNNNSAEIFKYFMEHGVNFNIADNQGITALHFAAWRGIRYITESLVKNGGKINVVDKRGRPPLHFAINSGNWDTVEFLVSHGSDINIADNQGDVAFHLAVLRNEYEIVELLVEHGADINILDRQRRTPLHLAALRYRRKIMEFLVERGVDVNAVDEDGRTALHFVLDSSRYDVVKYLIDHGAKLNIADTQGCTALHLAALRGNMEITKFVVEQGVDLNTTDGAGRTAMHFAVDSGDHDTVRFLQEQGGDINTADKEARTPLHFAVLRSRYRIVDLFVNCGVNVDAVDKKRRTALHLAVLRDRHAIVELLLHHGVDIDVVDSEGFKAIHVAILRGRNRIVELFVEHGVDINVVFEDCRKALLK